MDNKYHVGLCMAGAVSAGAYTAGVMDYLIEAIDAWEKARKTDESIPGHEVIIDVIGGASAGGMTSIIAAIALQKQFEPVRRNTDDHLTQNPFYDSWVNLDARDMIQKMLYNNDAIKGRPVKSIFNSSFIDRIAHRTIHSFTPGAAGRGYIHPNMDVFVTLSNLVGIPYNLRFRGNADQAESYRMVSYRDVGHFNFCGDYAGDGKINITGEENENMKILRQCAMATGAFPFGLQYREVHRNLKFLKENRDLQEFIGRGEIDWKKLEAICEEKDIYKTVNADGGMMNNEPFEIAMNLLQKKTGNSIEQLSSYKNTNGSILMIDPFPTEDVKLKYEDNFNMGSLAGKLFGAMSGQLVFKEEDIHQAINSENASRYMIVPKRRKGNIREEGARAIACGALGGFSGFFDFNFREHDYFLGRYNCQKFIRDVFTIRDPENNAIMREGYSHPSSRGRFWFKDKEVDGTEVWHAPIIPDIAWDKRYNKMPEKYYLDWPKFDPEIHSGLKQKFRKRFRYVFNNSFEVSIYNKIMLSIGYSVVLGKMMTNKTMHVISDELKKHDLL